MPAETLLRRQVLLAQRRQQLWDGEETDRTGIFAAALYSMAMSSTVVEVAALRKRFGEVTALDGVDLAVAQGEVFGLLGPNGAGKTTTIKTLITLLQPDGGSASVLGHDVVKDAGRVRSLIGYVPQELTGDRYLSAREHLEYFCDLYHLPHRQRAGRVRELLELVGLAEVAERPIRTFSGGMKKKLDVACGLVHRPQVLFLDEPSLGLDVSIRRAVWDHILTLKRAGTTVFVSTNYMEEADALCDRVAIIDRGQVRAMGTPMELRAGLGGDVVSIELEAGGPDLVDQAEAALRAVKVVKGTWRQEHKLHATVEANETALPVLLESLSAAKVKVRGVSYHRPGLEEVFLRHTGHRFEEAAGPSGPPQRAR